MRILFVCNEYPLPSTKNYGGIGTFTRTLAQGLSERGHTVFVAGYDQEVSMTTWDQDGNVEILRVANPFLKWPRLKVGRWSVGPQMILERMYLSRQAAKLSKDHAVQIVESYDWVGPLWSAPHHPLVVRLHGANTAYSYYEKKKISRILRFFERRNIQLADKIVAVSKHIGELTLEALDFEDHAFEVIYNSVDTNVFYPRDVDRNPFQVLFVGKAHPRKGIYELLQAWPQVIDMIPEAQLVFVGTVRTEKMNEAMSKWPLNLVKSVQFAGRIPHHELPDWYSKAGVAVFPSHAEAFGLTCAEAMACACPVIMTQLASGPELVADGQSGLLVDPTDPQDIADAIIEILRDHTSARTLGENARQRVANMFSHDIILEKNLALYERLIS